MATLAAVDANMNTETDFPAEEPITLSFMQEMPNRRVRILVLHLIPIVGVCWS